MKMVLMSNTATTTGIEKQQNAHTHTSRYLLKKKKNPTTSYAQMDHNNGRHFTDMVHLKKDRTDPSIYQQLFVEIRDRYRDYIPV